MLHLNQVQELSERTPPQDPPTIWSVSPPITHRGRYGSRFEHWWPYYYNLMVYVSEEAMFSLSLSPGCSYLVRPAAGANLQCIKQAAHTYIYLHIYIYKRRQTHTEARACVMHGGNEREGEFLRGIDWAADRSVYLWIIHLSEYTLTTTRTCNVGL